MRDRPSSPSAEIRIYAGATIAHVGRLACAIEVGRESDIDAGRLYVLQAQPQADFSRIAIAPKDFSDMSRRLMLMTPIGKDRLRLKNLSGTNTVFVELGEPLGPGQERECELPVALTVFDRRIECSPAPEGGLLLNSLEQPIEPPGSMSDELTHNRPRFDPDSTASVQIVEWLGAVARVLQSAVGSVDFYERAAHEMVQLVGLDSGCVLNRTPDDKWEVAAYHDQDVSLNKNSWRPMSQLLDELVKSRRTFWVAPDQSGAVTASMAGVSVAVASPLLGADGAVVGALYGERRLRGDLLYPPEITPLDAILVETMARGVSAGRARVEHERMAVESRLRFEQFFTPELSRHLTASPDLLVCKDTEVTMLFCDIRLFSSIGERMGPAQTMEWLSDVMGTMADRAAKYEGVLVDFIGDELMLMWGAPSDQPDHPSLACRAALDMARAVRDLDDKWRAKIGERTELGFGINTGVARVGNVGFERKFRYAPLGNAVNLASRVQGATKYLGAEVVVTEDTFARMKVDCLTRRLCAVRVVNIGKAVQLYQLCMDGTDQTRKLCQQYEEALKKFEASEFTNAAHIISDVLREHPTDRPSLLLLSRAVDQLVHGSEAFDGVFELPGK